MIFLPPRIFFFVWRILVKKISYAFIWLYNWAQYQILLSIHLLIICLIIYRPVFRLKHIVLETAFCLHQQVEPTQFGRLVRCSVLNKRQHVDLIHQVSYGICYICVVKYRENYIDLLKTEFLLKYEDSAHTLQKAHYIFTTKFKRFSMI